MKTILEAIEEQTTFLLIGRAVVVARIMFLLRL